jgi:CheY-like chemotaxis protein
MFATVHLSRYSVPGAAARVRGPRMDRTNAPDPRVLVIDDDDDLRTLVVRVVKQAGYAVDSASDGQAGLERLAEQTYDVIVCDLRMPRMDGVTFYREVERRDLVAARRVVFMTAHVRTEEYMDFLQGIHAPVLNKPFTLDEFRSTLARMVGPRP